MAQNKAWIVGYGCTSSAGPSTQEFWEGLCKGIDHSNFMPTEAWPVPLTFRPRACLWTPSVEHSSVKKILNTQLLSAWKQASASSKVRGKLGVIFASTKGIIDDFAWGEPSAEAQSDPLTPVLNEFLKTAGLEPHKSLCMSNACASSLSAMFLAKLWIEQGEVSSVLILAADRIGPFVAQGFQSLRALSPTQARPFDHVRDGLQLGEAAVAILLSSSPQAGSESFELEGVGLDTEGYAATRPSLAGDSLNRACLQIPNLRELPPDLIIAHGTSTVVNDQVEDHVFGNLFGMSQKPPFITGTKWSIGHTLGASGGMDVIAACQVLRTQKLFHLANTLEIDPTFQGDYLAHLRPGLNSSSAPNPVQRVLVTSLGFGGVHAAATLRFSGGSA